MLRNDGSGSFQLTDCLFVRWIKLELMHKGQGPLMRILENDFNIHHEFTPSSFGHLIGWLFQTFNIRILSTNKEYFELDFGMIHEA